MVGVVVEGVVEVANDDEGVDSDGVVEVDGALGGREDAEGRLLFYLEDTATTTTTATMTTTSSFHSSSSLSSSSSSSLAKNARRRK